jgi:hypothetical protein
MEGGKLLALVRSLAQTEIMTDTDVQMSTLISEDI